MGTLRNRLYYGLKPWLPFGLRLAIRRWFAQRNRDNVSNIWPIMPQSERPPRDWRGWPNGKQFALVLTHDVEGEIGLGQVSQVMDLETRLGFHSSFNLIPAGTYSVTADFRNLIKTRGFELGVHDLHHDGKLFSSRAEFKRKALQINNYLQEWGASGFRSGFMLHNLSWVHELKVHYDASTFDTDPFEPQPQGRNTIFPFWVPREPGRAPDSPPANGYAELPYTLPQDSTLFLLLQERHPDIWFQKLDWVARHGGMALVNVHPDYLRLEGEPPSNRTYPIEFYSRFLEYARQRYGEVFWHPLPREMADFVAQGRWVTPPRKKRICMVTYSYFESDARVTRYAEALAGRGDEVDVVALKYSPEEASSEKSGGIRLTRMQPRLGKQEKSRLSFLFPVLRFLITSSFWVARQHSRKPYDLLHVHNVPDFLVFAAWYPKLTGAKVILDIHDIVPEFYSSKFGSSESSIAVRLLKWSERASARFADHVIISNHLWRDKYASRTGLNGNCSVFINNVDGKIFRARPRTRSDDKVIILFPGGLQWHQGLDIAIRAFQKLLPEAPRAEFHIYGDGNRKAELVDLTRKLGLDNKVLFFKGLPLRRIADIMANADLGVVPKRADSFGNEAYSTKIMEFLSLGIPVVVSSTKIDRYYFNDSVVRFFESGNEEALAKAMLEVIRDPKLRESLNREASAYVALNSWERKSPEYLDLVDSLTGNDEA